MEINREDHETDQQYTANGDVKSHKEKKTSVTQSSPVSEAINMMLLGLTCIMVLVIITLVGVGGIKLINNSINNAQPQEITQ